MAARDNFSAPVRNALALRAAYRCSICNQATVGPSDEAPTATSNIGTAAHICAAAPGGPRYDSKMTSDQRTSIDNGIWLCANHGRLVDTDVITYTVEVLQQLKAAHHSRCKQALTAAAGEQNVNNLIAFGPEIVAVGEINYAQDHQWHFEVEHFVTGDFPEMVRLASHLRSIPEYDRHVLVNNLGEGRSIGSLSVRREGARVLVECQVAPNAPRTPAESLPTDFALSENHDLMLKGGDIALVSGIAALPQKLLTCLSMRRGESPFFPNFGARLAEYLVNYMGSPWLEELLKLDIVRLASIPYFNPISKESYTPLLCVERVFRVAILGDLVDGRLPIRLELEIAGLGPWSRNLAVHVG